MNNPLDEPILVTSKANFLLQPEFLDQKILEEWAEKFNIILSKADYEKETGKYKIKMALTLTKMKMFQLLLLLFIEMKREIIPIHLHLCKKIKNII